MDETELLALLSEWWECKNKLDEIKPVLDREQALRRKLREAICPDAEEGTFAYPLSSGWTIKVGVGLDRQVENELIAGVTEEVRKKFKVDVGEIINYKPILDVKGYRALLKAKPKAAALIDTLLTIKPRMPTITLEPPKAPAYEPPLSD